MKVELGSLFVPDKFVQNFNAFRMRHSRRLKEFKVAIDILKKENSTSTAEAKQLKKQLDETRAYHLSREADLQLKLEEV